MQSVCIDSCRLCTRQGLMIVIREANHRTYGHPSHNSSGYLRLKWMQTKFPAAAARPCVHVAAPTNSPPDSRLPIARPAFKGFTTYCKKTSNTDNYGKHGMVQGKCHLACCQKPTPYTEHRCRSSSTATTSLSWYV